MNLRKDRRLDELARAGNVAQFVSFEPSPSGPVQTFSRVRSFDPNQVFASVLEAIGSLLPHTSSGSVNVRSFIPENPRNGPFVYGLTDPAEVVAEIESLTKRGLHTILNETIDVHDGGVSGVAQGGVIEFSPDDTPRCVEKSGTASLPLQMGLDLLENVYGFRPDLPEGGRVEFSIHPQRQGWRQTHTILWEWEEDDTGREPLLCWPNRFSRHIGDKAYGLLMAHLAGVPVPRTNVIPRRVAPFAFGRLTGASEVWIRTCPTEQQPGRFTTQKGWLDPFRLLDSEDPDHNNIASILAQNSVSAGFSGASLIDSKGRNVIEGVKGEGEKFMLGIESPQPLPDIISRDVEGAMERLVAVFGPVRTEWVHDGKEVWILQLHRGATGADGVVIVQGEPREWLDFNVNRGLEALRSLLSELSANTGVRLIGQVGVTSHIADLVRKANVPAKLHLPSDQN